DARRRRLRPRGRPAPRGLRARLEQRHAAAARGRRRDGLAPRPALRGERRRAARAPPERRRRAAPLGRAPRRGARPRRRGAARTLGLGELLRGDDPALGHVLPVDAEELLVALLDGGGRGARGAARLGLLGLAARLGRGRLGGADPLLGGPEGGPGVAGP